MPPEPARDDWEGRRRWDTDWQRLFDAGYAGINWPAEVGGRGASPTEQLIFLEETEKAHAPYVGVNFVGLLHAGPTLIAEASDEQKARHLPAILKGEQVWCQGFSEPGRLDLASLRTRAVRDDDYVISGQKIWTSFAQVADYCELLVRTSPDAEAPGHHLAHPPHGQRASRSGRSAPSPGRRSSARCSSTRWGAGNRRSGGRRLAVAMVTFSFEQGTGARQRDAPDHGAAARSGALVPASDASARRELGRLRADLGTLWALTKRNVSQAARTGVPGVGGSPGLHYSETRNRLGDLAMRVLDRGSLSFEDEHVQGRVPRCP